MVRQRIHFWNHHSLPCTIAGKLAVALVLLFAFMLNFKLEIVDVVLGLLIIGLSIIGCVQGDPKRPALVTMIVIFVLYTGFVFAGFHDVGW